MINEIKKILWIEDEPNSKENKIPDGVRTIFRQENFEIILALTTDEAVTQLNSIQFSGIILDLMVTSISDDLKHPSFPSMGGLTILEKLHRDEFSKSGNVSTIPLVVLTAVLNRPVLEKTRELLGVDASISLLFKPCNPQEVVDCIATIINRKK
jgi:CheY-like chemotaxis protein